MKYKKIRLSFDIHRPVSGTLTLNRECETTEKCIVLCFVKTWIFFVCSADTPLAPSLRQSPFAARGSSFKKFFIYVNIC